jgi:tetratricopeptide (TPR) repeat protein
MLYSILPPIIVVLSLVGIIIFLVKKSSKIKKVYRDDAAELARNKSFENGAHFGTATDGKNNHKWEKAENIFLIILEKTTRRMRTFSLKLEVWFSGLSGKIRNRRNKVNPRNEENNSENKQEEKILEKVIDYKSKGIFEKKSITKDNFSASVQTEKIAEPMISKNVTLPKAVPGIKNKLEELLIERVAANPKDMEAYERLGEYYMEIENYADAKECFKQVLKLNPTNRNVRYKIKRLERLLGE